VDRGSTWWADRQIQQAASWNADKASPRPAAGPVNQFRIYLRGELGKLSDRSDAANFIAAVRPSGLLAKVGLGGDPESLSRQLGSRAAVDELVATLPPDVLEPLAQCCGDVCRANPDLYRKLTSSNEWLKQDVPIDSIRLQQAEPRLGEIFAELDYRLTAVAADPRVLSSPPYSCRTARENVDYPVCLAKRHAGVFYVFDGIHRAIQLVRNGQTHITLCFSEDPETAG